MKLKYIATIYSSSFLRRFPNINKLPAIANPTPVNPTLVSVSPVLAKRFVTFGDCTSLYLSSLFIGESIATVPPLNSGISTIGGVIRLPSPSVLLVPTGSVYSESLLLVA